MHSFVAPFSSLLLAILLWKAGVSVWMRLSAPARKRAVISAKWTLLLLVSLSIVAGFLWLPPARGFQRPDLARIVVFHVPCWLVAGVATTMGAWFAVRFLWKRELSDDAKSSVAFALGLLFWIWGTVTGAIWAKPEWGAAWNWDIKQKCIVMLILVNVAYFALRAAIDEPNRRARLSAAYTLFAFLAMPLLTYILPNSTEMTLHPKGVVSTRAGMSPEYRAVFYASCFGLTCVYVWAFRLHVALAEIERKIQNFRPRKARPEPNPVHV